MKDHESRILMTVTHTTALLSIKLLLPGGDPDRRAKMSGLVYLWACAHGCFHRNWTHVPPNQAQNRYGMRDACSDHIILRLASEGQVVRSAKLDAIWKAKEPGLPTLGLGSHGAPRRDLPRCDCGSVRYGLLSAHAPRIRQLKSHDMQTVSK